MPHVSFYYDKKGVDDRNIPAVLKKLAKMHSRSVSSVLRLAVWAAAEAVDARQPFFHSINVNPPPFNPFRAPPATRLGRSA